MPRCWLSRRGWWHGLGLPVCFSLAALFCVFDASNSPNVPQTGAKHAVPLSDADLKQDGSIEPPPDLSTPGHRSYLQSLLSALQLIRSGDFSVRMPGDSVGIEGKIADTFNEIVAANQQMAKELELVGQVVGREGKTRKRVVMGLPQGAWREMEDSINTLIDDLLWPTVQVTGAIAAVAKGDLLKRVPLEVDGRPLLGEFLTSATIVNTMIGQLGIFTSEVTRVAREVGTEGKLGGQARCRR